METARRYTIKGALVVTLLCVLCYLADKETFVMLSKYVLACACYEDFDIDARNFREWQRLQEEQASIPPPPAGAPPADVEAAESKPADPYSS